MHKAAIRNDPDSMYHLARMQLDGCAPEFTTAYAKYWLDKSVSLGFYKAFAAISDLYQNGKNRDNARLRGDAAPSRGHESF